MSRSRRLDSGFTIVELLVAISLIGTLLLVFSLFFINSYQSYLNLQQNTIRMNDLSNGLQRVARVIRGISAITDASSSSLTGLAYFTPRDTTLSRVRYFYDAPSRSLKVGVIAASGTAPNFTYNTANERITTIAENVNVTQPVFIYLDISGVETTFTSDTFKDIQSVKIQLANDKVGQYTKQFQLETTVSLRNRKTNL